MRIAEIAAHLLTEQRGYDDDTSSRLLRWLPTPILRWYVERRDRRTLERQAAFLQGRLYAMVRRRLRDRPGDVALAARVLTATGMHPDFVRRVERAWRRLPHDRGGPRDRDPARAENVERFLRMVADVITLLGGPQAVRHDSWPETHRRLGPGTLESLVAGRPRRPVSPPTGQHPASPRTAAGGAGTTATGGTGAGGAPAGSGGGTP